MEPFKTTEKIIGDRKFTTKEYGNPNHYKFWHKLKGCSCIRSETETIMSPDRPEYTRSYYNCGYWKEYSVIKIQ